jgi:hypothetical protein
MKQASRYVTRVFAAVIPVLTAADAASAQKSGAPDEAKTLIVRVAVRFGQSSEPELGGTGILIGSDGSAIYIVTARHVVVQESAASEIWVRLFGRQDSVRATFLPHGREGYDVAVLRVERSALHGWRTPALDRLGDPRALEFRAEVSPMGCAQGVRCWDVPVPADRVVGLDLTTGASAGILFQSAAFLGEGASGGALFNEWWEVVGVVLEHDAPRGRALPIDDVLSLLRSWGVPVGLKRSKLPREGYRTLVGVTLLSAIGASQDSNATESRLPSGRLTAVRRTRTSLTWHAGLMRLAPDNLLVTAGMAGVGANFTAGRISAQPFVEVGLGRAQARSDRGGYYAVEPNGDRYIPVWTKSTIDGLGVGGGISLQYLVIPHVAVEALAARWSFALPENSPDMPSLFLGGGVRWVF